MNNPHYDENGVTLYHGDCLEVISALPDNSVDSVVTDPPYELGFMGKKWDNSGIAYSVELWTECFRVLKPGGHLLAFGGSRTWHRLAVAIEDSGFEVRDSIAWMYGQGFPKSLDVGKALEAQAKTGSSSPTAQRKTAMGSDYKQTPLAGTPGYGTTGNFTNKDTGGAELRITSPAAQQWQGWGTALKPAFEPIVVARKPLIGTVAENVLAHGTGALNIDASRIGRADGDVSHAGNRTSTFGTQETVSGGDGSGGWEQSAGRWPANVILDESQAAELDKQSGVTKSGKPRDEKGKGGIWAEGNGVPCGPQHGDEGGASRFFYCAKPSKKERPKVNGVAHPTVKPLKLMRYLVKLVTPPGGVVLDPFAGSGTTLEAAVDEGFDAIGIELTEEYLPLIVDRLEEIE